MGNLPHKSYHRSRSMDTMSSTARIGVCIVWLTQNESLILCVGTINGLLT
jgi:hypothetical protein